MERGKPLMQSENPLVDFDAVCQKVRAAVEPNRTHAVSLHDESGDVLWLSESSMGPDEHNAVREAAEAFGNPAAAPILSFDLGDSKTAVMVRAVNARRAMVGLIMVVMDTRIVAQGAPKRSVQTAPIDQEQNRGHDRKRKSGRGIEQTGHAFQCRQWNFHPDFGEARPLPDRHRRKLVEIEIGFVLDRRESGKLEKCVGQAEDNKCHPNAFEARQTANAVP